MKAAVIDDVIVVFEDPVRQPVVAHILPNVLDRIELRRFGRKRNECDVFGYIQLRGDVPAGLIHEQHGMGSWLHGECDLVEMQFHRLGVARRQDETGRLAERRADSAEDIGRGGSLIFQGKRSCAAFGPPPRDLVLLADAGFVLEPEFERLACRSGDCRQEGWNFFLNAATTASSCS